MNIREKLWKPIFGNILIRFKIDLSNNTPKTTEKSNKDGDTIGERLQPVFVMLEPKVKKMDYWALTGKEGFIEGSLEVKLPTIWTVEKQRWEESEETRSEERRCRCAKR